MVSFMSPSQGTLATAACTTDGLLGYQSTILPTSWPGQRMPSVAASGNTAVSPDAATDGTDLFVVTGNTFTSPGDPWSGGEAIIRFQAGLIFSSFWAPTNWQSLDNSDAD